MNGRPLWLSATATGRLLRCPASATPVTSPSAYPATKPDNAGSLAHLALGAWLTSGGWRDDGAGSRLQQAWDEQAEEWGVDGRRMPDGVMTRARLRARGAQLAEELARHGTRARSEVFLSDPGSQLYGQLDVIIDGGDCGGAVVDLKTGRDGTDDLIESARAQLLTYAHLFRSEQGYLPAALIAFSLRRGALRIEYSESDVDALLARVHEFRASSSAQAIPHELGCRYCPRRLRCEPHWSSAQSWADPDCLDGIVTKIEVATAGVLAVRVATGVSEQWVTGLPAAVAAEAATGDYLRLTEAIGAGDVAERSWRATRGTRWRFQRE